MHKCRKCFIEKPMTLEYFRKDTRIKSGFDTICKACRHLMESEIRAKNYDKIKGYRVKWTESNREKLKERGKQYRLNTDKKILNERTRKSTEKKKSYYNAKERDRRKKHKENKDNRIKFNLQAQLDKARREAKKANLPCDWTKSDWEFCLKYFDNSCAVCGRNDIKLAQDHWIPLTYQGDNPGTVPHNILPLCHGKGGCNLKKSNKIGYTWLKNNFDNATEIENKIREYFDIVRR